MSSWLFQDNVWNNLNSNTGYGNTYLEIFIKDLKDDSGASNGYLAFQSLYIIDYSKDNPRNDNSKLQFTVSHTNKVPNFVDPNPKGENYYFKYRIKLSELLTLLNVASTPVARMQSLSNAFNSKWDPEVNGGNGNWVYSYKASSGPSKLGLYGKVLSQSSITL
jgi:hypothetical protein